MRVLVTGGAGYVGSVAVETLLHNDHDVTVLDDCSTGHAASLPPESRLEIGSFGDRDLVQGILERREIDAILHLGARSLVGESIANPSPYYGTNVAGGLALLEAARAAGVQRLVFSSSAAIYGTPDRSPVPETAALRPINPYGETKRAFEAALAWYGEAYGLRSVSLRYFNAAGATALNGEDHHPETHLVPVVLRIASEGGAVTLFGDDYPTADGTCVRDYVHVEDLAVAHLLALEATSRALPVPAEPVVAGASANALACNLGSGRGFSVRDVVGAAERVVGHAIPTLIGARRTGDPAVLVAEAELARSLLGWAPAKVTLEEMIGSAWAWLRGHPNGYAR